MKTGCLILAAGSSTRLGEPKQLLKFDGKTLLRRAAETALSSVCHPVVVILGANAERLKKEIEDLPLEIVVNKNWANGLSASIKTGVSALRAKNPDRIVLMLCDQLFVTSQTLNNLVEIHQKTRKPIVGCEYESTIGVPALFAREMFDELLDLQGDVGAKALFKKHAEKVAKTFASEAAFDVDIRSDYEKLLKLTRTKSRI